MKKMKKKINNINKYVFIKCNVFKLLKNYFEVYKTKLYNRLLVKYG